MDSFELNKLLGALLGAVFIMFSVSLISDSIFYAPTPAVQGYNIEVPETEPTDVADVDTGPSAVELIAQADIGAGEAAFRRCVSCHTSEEGGANRVGPNLWNTVMQPITHAEGFSYSAAMREFAAQEEIWTYEHLSGFLQNPRGYVPGTTMAFAGIRDPQEKANLIAYMRTLSNDPAPLPEVEEAAEVEAVEEEEYEVAAENGEAMTEEAVETEAQPVEPTPPTDGTEAAPEVDAGTPAVEDADTPEAVEEEPAATEDEQPAAVEEEEPALIEEEEDGAAVVPQEAEVDLAAGSTWFRRQCAACHTMEQGGPNRIGPNLWDVVGREVATVEGFNYSAAMRAFAEGGTVWDEANLDEYLTNPRGLVPGTTMAFVGQRDAQARADLIGYMRSYAE